MSAQTLIESGARVHVVDAGLRDERYNGLVPAKTFVELRTSDEQQHRYLLGEDFEGLPNAAAATGAQLTPPRSIMVAQAQRFLPLISETFSPLESLAFGGLGLGWGLGCCVFSAGELRAAGLDMRDMEDAYRIIARRIGLSGAHDDATPYTSAFLHDVQPAPPLSPLMASVRARYLRKRDVMRREGFALGRPALAMLTQPHGDRHGSALRELEFYDDPERSAWRPPITIDALRQHRRFSYEGSALVTRFDERDGGVDVTIFDVRTSQYRQVHARRLVIAAGALGTARIVLRSSQANGVRLPLLCNAYSYLPCIVASQLGGPAPARDLALAQLALFHDADATGSDVAMASLYSYRSLMLFRLLASVPLPVRDAVPILRFLQPALLIAGLHQPDSYAPGCYIERVAFDSPTGDGLRAAFHRPRDITQRHRRRERLFARALARIGARPVKTVQPIDGASIHYAGTLPYSDEARPFALARDGRLHGTASVYVADGSGFTFLPAKGLTLSLMANAHRVAAGMR